MRVALISPKGSFLGKSNAFKKFYADTKFFESYRNTWSGLTPGLLIISSLTPSSYKMEIIDENIDTINFSNNYDLVGISFMTQQATRAYQIADKFRSNNVTVVLGGIHATVMPEEAKIHADSVIIGEAEYLWPEFIDDFENHRIKPFYKSEKEVDLKDSPIPRYELIKDKNYRIIWIQTTRGCPHDCEFCAASKIYGHKYRKKSIEQVIEEVKLVRKIFGNIQIGFSDDNLFVDKHYSISLLEQLIPLKIKWVTQTDIFVAEKEEILNLLHKSGCSRLFIGFESLSEKNLKGIDKHNWKFHRLKKYSHYIKKIQSHGIGIIGAFILGLENDDISVFNKTENFILENFLADIQISILTPLPGTRLRRKLEKEKRILPTEWDNYTFWDVNFIHKILTKEQLENGVLKIYQNVNSEKAYLHKLKHFKEIHKSLLEQEMF
jgi:radical SAM superfamily enzyme YgiQ (UPF0313 family)